MKRKWWILGGVALTAAISLCFFRVRIRIAPRLILSKALSSAIEQVDHRFENSPVHLLAAALDSQGRQEVMLKLETEEKHLGTVVYDMSVNTQLSPNRILAEGSVFTGGRLLDLSLYLDENFAAVSSQGLVDGKFYGINYDTFPQDIRRWQLLAALIGEKTISDWETSVSSLQKKMAVDLSLPDVKPEDIRTALYAALALKPVISREEIVLSDGIQNAYGVSFQATGDEIASAAEKYRTELTPELLALLEKLQRDPESAVSATFILYNEKLVQIEAELKTKAENTVLLMHLGENPAAGTISLEMGIREGENLDRYGLQIMTVSDAESYQETLNVLHIENAKQNRITLEYQWDLSSGDMALEIQHGGKKIQQRLNLTGEGETFTVRARDIRPLLNLLLDQDRADPAICTLIAAKGGEVAVPEYQNLDQWSAQDLFGLLGGLGGLIGLRLP